jgi:hypothetical protein
MAKPKPPKKKLSAAKSRAPKASKPAQGASEFSAGDRVVHPQFGEGKVLTVHVEKLTIQFKGSGIKEVLIGFVARRH